MSKPELVIGPIQYGFNEGRYNHGDQYSYTAKLKNCNPEQCKVFMTVDHEGREMPLEEFEISRSGELDINLPGSNTYHMYLFCGSKLMDAFKYNYDVKFEKIHDYCKDPANECTITKETIHAVPPPPIGGRHRKSHRRSSGSKRCGSKRRGSKRRGSKRCGSKRRRH
jgi:hypothetical protein